MAEESQERAERDVTAATEGYGGPVSDEELADVYLPEGQERVQDTGSAEPAGDAGDSAAGGDTTLDPAPDSTGTLHGAPEQPAIEPPD